MTELSTDEREALEESVQHIMRAARQNWLTGGVAEAAIRSALLAARPAVDVEDGVSLIAAERQRQIDVEGYDVGHDSVHSSDALIRAAVCYATPAHMRLALAGRAPLGWPWGVSHWKPTPDDRVRELVKAGALIAAEIDRLNYRAGEGRG